MDSLPKLPGFTFSDPTLTKFHLSQTFELCNGYKLPKIGYIGIGGRELDASSVRYLPTKDSVRYDPAFTYGRSTRTALPQFKPHYAYYDQKCLTFKAFFKQSVVESPLEYYRVRHVNIIYFLEDDTITVMEPRVLNSGIEQGRLVKRGKIPKTETGEYWHWKDLDVGKDIAIYGITYHTVDCDVFTKEYMASQGLTMGDREELPPDEYTLNRYNQMPSTVTKTPSADDKFRKFLEYDGKILNFKAVWDDRDSEHGELRKYVILYFLADDSMMVKECHKRNDGRDPFPLLLRKTKIPKIWTDKPSAFPAVYMETSEEEITEFYQPKDLKVGETVFLFGRRMFLYDCDEFTRNYYKQALCIQQKPPIDIEEKRKPPPERPMPPHDGLGSLEDTMQNVYSLHPTRPRDDVIKQIYNANKYLRYEMQMDAVHPEDSIRRFILFYNLGTGTCKVHEPPIRNSGIWGGKYLRSCYLQKPKSDPLNPAYYTPADFYIGAIINIFEQRFVITGADLYVYRYMEANPGKFPCDVIDNMRNYMFNKGFLKSDIASQIEENQIKEKDEFRESMGKNVKYKPIDDMEECMRKMQGDGDDPNANEDEHKAHMRQQPTVEELTKHNVPPYGIQPINTICPNTIYIGDESKKEKKISIFDVIPEKTLCEKEFPDDAGCGANALKKVDPMAKCETKNKDVNKKCVRFDLDECPR